MMQTGPAEAQDPAFISPEQFAMSSTTSSEDLKFGGALLVTAAGFVLIGVLVYVAISNANWKPSDVTALVGAVTTLLGTLVGAFLGVQAGSTGKAKAEGLANRALAALKPEEAARVMQAK
jgi:hypothetical protein